MKCVYEASSSLDAYMILNLLEQEGIYGRVDGEYLPGGVGELQAMNLVRVMVDESDYERARQVISDWEAIQVEREERATRKPAGRLAGFMVGAVMGGGLVYWAYNTPVTGHGVDLNGDGVPDEMRVFRDNRISRTELDRDYDGAVDAVFYFDRRGILKEAKFDDNFDGIYETTYEYKDGLTHSQESDMNEDGHIDYRASFRYGNLDEVVITGEGQDVRTRRQRFHMGKLISAEYDADGDGSFETEYGYNCSEEIR